MLTKLMEWNVAGLAVGLAVLVLGCVGILLARRTKPGFLRKSGLSLTGLIAVAGTLLTLGGVIHLVTALTAGADHPPRGRVVDVGGYKMHIFCEGTVSDVAPIVWMSGGR